MKIYRVTIQTDILVEAENEVDAEKIALDNFREETPEFYSAIEIDNLNKLTSDEQLSLPWRSWERRGEDDLTIKEILENNG